MTFLKALFHNPVPSELRRWSCQGVGHRIVECLASTVINKSKAGSDSNLCTVESRHISAHRRLERCSSRIWQVWWSMHKQSKCRKE
jgi:hypothetical protein